MDSKLTSVTFDVDLEKFRYSLIGDGYIKEEVVKMSEKDLIEILEYRVESHILREYEKGKKMELYD